MSKQGIKPRRVTQNAIAYMYNQGYDLDLIAYFVGAMSTNAVNVRIHNLRKYPWLSDVHPNRELRKRNIFKNNIMQYENEKANKNARLRALIQKCGGDLSRW